MKQNYLLFFIAFYVMMICVEAKQRNYKRGFDSRFKIPGKEIENNTKKEEGRDGKCKYTDGK